MAAPQRRALARAALLAALAAAAALCAPAALEAAPGAPYAPISLDRGSYTWTDSVGIRVHAPSWNADRHGVDSIGGEEPYFVRVSTRGHELRPYRLAETGPNTGVFAGEVALTGFAHDADGDGRPDARPRTSGSGPSDGLLPAGRDDAVTVSFAFDSRTVLSASAPVRWSAGEAAFVGAPYAAGRDARFEVRDPDMNLDPRAPDRVAVAVSSSSDPAGVEAHATETGAATGVFEGSVRLSAGGPSGGGRLHAAPGDSLSLVYDDRTPPAPRGAGDALRAEASARLGPEAPPLGRASQAPLRAAGGAWAGPGSAALIAGGVDNLQGRAQDFVLVVQVRDAGGRVVALSWASGSLGPLEGAAVSLPWGPPAPGRYAAEAFAWESLASPGPLSPPQRAEIRVGGAPRAPP